jgi:Tfp pilus assembly protein PilN
MKAVNLLPPNSRGAVVEPALKLVAAPSPGAAGAVAVLVALALGAAGSAAYVLTGNQVRQAQADVVSAQARSAAVVARSAALKPFADFESTTQARVATVRDLATSRFDWEHAFRDLARAVPSDVTVKQLSASVSTGGGSAASPLRGAISAPAITLSGCTVDQDAVARAMARLRAVDGVTRVTLAKSTKPTQAGSSGAGKELCTGTEGGAPDFQVVAFFENATAATAAATAASGVPSTVAPTPTPTSTPGGAS